MDVFKKLLPFARTESDKPLHAGEIYYLWESLTSGYNVISIIENYQMNTEDSELHLLLQGIVKGNTLTRINPLEKLLKQEGFTVPPQPPSKILQGKPGAGQEVKLDDDEVLRDLVALTQVMLIQDARAVGAATRESVRKVFTDLLFNDMKIYELIDLLANKRRVKRPPPPATAKENGLNMGEVAILWDHINARHISMSNLEIFIANTTDRELIKLLNSGLNNMVILHLEKLENKLKEEDFTVPARPVRRVKQGPPGVVNKIKMNDGEIIKYLISAAQVAVDYHVRSFFSAAREDIRDMFKGFLSSEIEFYQKTMSLASTRHALINPPQVASRKG